MLVRIAILILMAACALAEDWPQFLGPARNGVYSGNDLAAKWPPAGPAVVWKKDVGEGYSSPVVADGKVVQCHRIGGELIVQCFAATTGHEMWRFARATKFQDGAFFDSGPRPTPTC